jgi:hypothetical protein
MGAPQRRRHHFDHGNSADQAARGIAVRVLKLMRIDPVPDFAFEQETTDRSDKAFEG